MTSPQKSWPEFTKSLAQYSQIGELRPVILQSWRRSRAAGLRRVADKPLLRRISLAELEERLEQSRQLIALSSPLLQDFSTSHAGMRHVIYVTDADGIVLHSVGYDLWRALYGLMPGFDWSEHTMGTNGAGTALATDQPVAVIGPDHFLRAFQSTTCLASPIHSPAARLIGAVDFSSSVEDARPEHLSEIVALAHEIEHALASQQNS